MTAGWLKAQSCFEGFCPVSQERRPGLVCLLYLISDPSK
jgi:hypothetical protein